MAEKILINSEAEFKEKTERYGTVICYGAGVVAGVVIKCFRLYNDERVLCAAVTDKRGNPAHVMGIPVCAIDDLEEYQKDGLIVMTTLENKHADICGKLREKGFRNIVGISNLLYAKLRRRDPDPGYEILLNTRSLQEEYGLLESRVRELGNEIQRIGWALNRMEGYMRKREEDYDTALCPGQYRQQLIEWYRQVTGRTLNLANPRTYNEKIQWLKLYGNNPLKTKLTDKYLVRQWVREKAGEEYLIPLLGVWECFDEIDFEKLPSRFVLKCNHGSDWNLVVRNSSEFNAAVAREDFNCWMASGFAFTHGLELQYRSIKPKIIAEEYVENEAGNLFDYKFWCFHGKVKFIMFLSEREKELKMNNFDRDWNPLPFVYDYVNSGRKIEKPEKLREMIALAEKLAEGFIHVRVDLYLLNDGSIKFGEMTFTPASGVCGWNMEEIDVCLGNLMDLSVREAGSE